MYSFLFSVELLDDGIKLRKVSQFAREIITWFKSMNKEYILFEHVKDDIFRASYKQEKYDICDEFVADPNHYGKYPLKLVVNGKETDFVVWGNLIDN